MTNSAWKMCLVRRIILKRILKKYDGNLDWIVLVDNRDKKRAVLKRFMYFGSIKCGKSLTQLSNCYSHKMILISAFIRLVS